MYVKRTEAEREAVLLGIHKLKSTPEWAIYEKELNRVLNAIACGAYRESGDQLAKTAGIIHGLEMALTIENMFLVKKN